MAILIRINGPAMIKVGTGGAIGGPTLEELGYTRDGAMVRLNPSMIDVPSDDAGGETAVADVEFISMTAHLTFEFTKFDDVVANKLVARAFGSLGGTPPTPGQLMFYGTGAANAQYAVRILILYSNTQPASAARFGGGPMNFLRCVLREPDEINRGTKYSTWRLEATAYKDDNGVLWNTTIT